MAGSSLYSIGSGLDIPTIVAGLVAADRKPEETRINNAGTAASSQLSAISTIKSGMSNLQTALKTLTSSISSQAYKTTVGEGAGFTATATTSATSGNYNVEVVSLAERQKLTSGAYASDKVVGDGTLTIKFGDDADDTLDVTIAEGAKLSDVAAAINKAAGGVGVTASVVSANDGQHLVLTAADTGTAGAMTVTSSGGNGGLAGLTYPASGGTGLTESVAAKDALVRVDGFERTSSSNSVADLIPGVVLNLTKANEGTKYSLSIGKDNTAIKTNISAFISAYNAVNTVLKSSSSYNADTQTASALTGDAMVRGLQQQMRSQVSGSVTELKALGVTIATDGSLSFDATKFETKVASDPNAAQKLFGNDGTVSKGLSSMLDSNLNSTNGSITLRSNSLNAQIKDLEEQLDDLDKRMAEATTRYTAKFTAMDTLVAQMQTTSNYLTQQLAASSSS
ncbi:MAG TPA: flagellar filament capping protein FliD [Stenotrophomonas sp.]|nr:flagellar filament capping protein FliD [Stenotrophomonas sp.]